MKLLRYGNAGQEKPGLLDENRNIRDLSHIISDISGNTLTTQGILDLQELSIDDLPIIDGVAQKDVRLGPCVGHVGKFICVGLNYSDHAAESGMEIPPEPTLFNKWTSAITGPDDDVQIPRGATKTDWEVELGIVIGEGGRYIDEENAMVHVAGFCVINDISEREFQLERSGTWDKGKGCDTFGPIGPWMVTKDEVGNYENLKIWLEVDGHRYQDGNTSTMVYKVPHIVAYCSQFMSLQPGDIISTGTPPGVGLGLTPPKYLKGGEVMKLGIEGLGTQTQNVLSDKTQ
ncbi:fumarylacetoacetate hydrolase family protein [Vibrio amylolyticus]|uniref:fumarylacetoacetate hydrolase family protein n=1 Tax=Vibrio amylolyticus TaxID=2847292 RepID=UPI00354B0EAA